MEEMFLKIELEFWPQEWMLQNLGIIDYFYLKNCIATWLKMIRVGNTDYSIYQKLLNSMTLNFVTTNSPFKDAFDDAKDFRDADQDIWQLTPTIQQHFELWLTLSQRPCYYGQRSREV